MRPLPDVETTGVINFEQFGEYASRRFARLQVLHAASLAPRGAACPRARSVLCSWNFCSFDMKALAGFAFNMFDTDSTGWLERKEVVQMLTDIYGSDVSTNERVVKLLDQLQFTSLGKASLRACAGAGRGAARAHGGRVMGSVR
jgi:hypothetical protein